MEIGEVLMLNFVYFDKKTRDEQSLVYRVIY